MAAVAEGAGSSEAWGPPRRPPEEPAGDTGCGRLFNLAERRGARIGECAKASESTWAGSITEGAAAVCKPVPTS